MGSASVPQDSVHSRAIAAALADLSGQRNEFLFKLPKGLEKLCLPLLQDKRDLPILYLFFDVAVMVLPATLALYCLPAWSSILGPAYLAAADVLFLERFLLALHYSQHRQLFRTGAVGIKLCKLIRMPQPDIKVMLPAACRSSLAESNCSSAAGAVVRSPMWVISNSSCRYASCRKPRSQRNINLLWLALCIIASCTLQSVTCRF